MWSLILELFENSDRMLLRIQLQSAYIQFHITNVLIFFRIKKSFVRLKAREHKAWRLQKATAQKGSTVSVHGGCAHHLHYSTMKWNAHVWQMFGVIFSNVLLWVLRPRPGLRPSTPQRTVTDPFLSLRTVLHLFLTCFLVFRNSLVAVVLELRIAIWVFKATGFSIVFVFKTWNISWKSLIFLCFHH